MPITKSRLTRTEAQEYRTRLLQLEKMGIPIWRGGDFWHEPDPLTVEQIDDHLAWIYELPLGEIAVVVFAELTVLRSGILIMDRGVKTQWDDFLDLSDPKESTYYEDIIHGLPSFPPKFLNHWLTGNVPLRPRQEEGVIFAKGWGSVPPECPDETLITVKLFLRDQRGNEPCFDFEARLDRSVKRKYQPRLRERLTNRVPIFQREDTEPRDQDRTIEQQVRGPISPSPGAVSVEKPIEGSPPDVPRDETDEPIGA
jgi:hypothetical protein